ncbi:MAG: RNase adapter RapZ [Candidatus Hydrogenedentes bacterium]|nr:RNase adapter RapZ [Candidatus Hydrogenedentota bacterium]
MPEQSRFVVVTGLSGAGKSQALRFLEDLGYFCIDNLPPSLIPAIAELGASHERPRTRIAVCVDVRGGEDLQNLPAYLDEVSEKGIRPEVLFLESSDAVSQKRYSESRRRHPAASQESVEEGIRRERELLSPIQSRADVVLDTSTMSVGQLRERVAAVFQAGQLTPKMAVGVMSFGFKYGVPQEADLVLDVRFLPNPHYIAELRPFSGEDAKVSDFVLDNPDAAEFLERVKGMLKFLLPRYAAEPKSYLTIAVGCTGGRHRSVAVARALATFVREMDCGARLRHRDIERALEGGD